MTEIRCPVEYCKYNSKFQEEYGVGICQAPILPLDTVEVDYEDDSEPPETLFVCLAFTNIKSKEEPPVFAPTIEEASRRSIEAMKKELASSNSKETRGKE
jgi:hypothetical protein